MRGAHTHVVGRTLNTKSCIRKVRVHITDDTSSNNHFICVFAAHFLWTNPHIYYTNVMHTSACVATHCTRTCSTTGAHQNHRRTDGVRTEAICVIQRSVGRSVCPSYTRERNSQSNLIDNRFLFQSITVRLPRNPCTMHDLFIFLSLSFRCIQWCAKQR